MDGFYLGLGEALREHGGRVLVVRPGFVHTKMTEGRDPAPLSVTADQVADAVVRGGRHPRRAGLGAARAAGRDVRAAARAASPLPAPSSLTHVRDGCGSSLPSGRWCWPRCCSGRRSAPATCSATTWCGCPHLDLRGDFLGFGHGAARAVPSDAVVAVLDDVVPAQLLEKIALFVPLVLAGVGAARLVGGVDHGTAHRGDPRRLEPVHGGAAGDRALDGARRLRRACPGWSSPAARTRRTGRVPAVVPGRWWRSAA